MKLLAISDIHGNLEAVRQLRSREENTFDSIIVAGDIGQETAGEVLETLSSFKCPVFYVYGNHDYALDYDRSFGNDCHHLHMRMIGHGPFTLCGFSGCPTQWGQNPIAQEIEAATSEVHQDVLRALEQAQKAFELAAQDYEAENTACEEAVANALGKLAEKAKAKGIDRRSSPYRAQAERCRARVQRLYGQHNSAFWKCRDALSELEKSPSCAAYLAQCRSDADKILKWNRQALSRAVTASRTKRESLIVITHERLPRANSDFAAVPLFLFGHRHGFTDTTHQGSRFVNVSPLDNSVALRPAHSATFKWEDCKSFNAGTYAVIEARSPDNIKVGRRDLEPPDGNWTRVTDHSYFINRSGRVIGFARA